MAYALATLALLMAAAWRDIATRTIPNSICLLILLVGGLARIFQGPTAFAFSAATALLVLVLLLLAYTRGLLGGGDVKIIAAIAIGLSPLDCYRFIVATAIAGGMLGLAYLLLSALMRDHPRTRQASLLRRVAAIEAWRIRRRGPLPYGVAIAAGATFVLLQGGST